MNMWGGPGILHILQLLFCTILTLRYYTIISLFLDSVHSLRSNKATLHHWETKPNRRFIHRNSQLTCIVQSVTVTLSHKSQYVMPPYPCTVRSQPYDTCVCRQLAYILTYERSEGHIVGAWREQI